MSDPPDVEGWGIERERFLEAVNGGDAGAAYYTLGRVSALADEGLIENPSWARKWVMRRVHWLEQKVARNGR